MKRTNVKTRFIALTLALISALTTFSLGAISTFAVENSGAASTSPVEKVTEKLEGNINKEGVVSVTTYEDMLKESISALVDDTVPKPFTPLFGLLGEDIIGESSDSEMAKLFNEIDSKLDDLKKEMASGFEKVLSEIDKNNKMRNAIDALSKAEFIAETIMENSRDEMQNEIFSDDKKLTPEQQKEIIEINADIVNNQLMTELYTNLKLAKDYMTTGFIDTDYKSIFDVYYSYMKKQSMFCGEAANKAEPFWIVMKESYAKSYLSLLYGLEHQKAIYLLSQSTPTDEISQEAIDAAAIAKTFGTLSVLENRIATANKDAIQLLDKYNQFVKTARAEATTFINKGTVYIELNPQIGNINISNCGKYSDYVAHNSFEKEGITESLYNKMIDRYPVISHDNGTTLFKISGVSYNNFINKAGKCSYEVVKSDASGTYFSPYTVELKEVIDTFFSTIMMDIKAEQFNHKNKLDNENISTIISHVTENYNHDTVASYLQSVGFNFGDLDVTEESNVLLPTGDFVTSNWRDRIGNKSKLYDVNTLNKKSSDFVDAIDIKNPIGKLLFFENAVDTAEVTIKGESMDFRIYKGVYTIEGKLIEGYTADQKPIYSHYEKVFEINGTDEDYLRLPEKIDMSTVKIILGYEGLLASDNHKCVCSYEFKNMKTPCSQIVLSMRGYTKAWLGYGVDASITCDGVVVAKGKG